MMTIPQEVEQLKDDLIWARHFYIQYQKLFGAGAKRIELLNKTAPRFFRDVQRLLWEQFIISIGRLTDPSEQGKNKNLSLHILKNLAQENNWDFSEKLNELVDEAVSASAVIRTWRMKKVAHRDLETALSKGVFLDSVDTAQVEKVFSLAGDAINLVYYSLADTSWSWDSFFSNDADVLVGHLKMAVVYKDAIKSEIKPQLFEKWAASRFKDA